jgi:DNA-binding NarL/FixJ family response regulator
MKYPKSPGIAEYWCGNSSRVFIKTNVPFLEVTLKFFAERFFSVSMGALYIIDATLFNNSSDLLNHLRRVSEVKPDVYILIVDDNIPAQHSDRKPSPWIISTKDSIQSLISALKALKTADNNFSDVVEYYENIRKMGRVDSRQAQMLELICMGKSIDHIASTMELSPKTVYYSLRKISTCLGMKNLPQLISFMLREHHIPFLMNINS